MVYGEDWRVDYDWRDEGLGNGGIFACCYSITNPYGK